MLIDAPGYDDEKQGEKGEIVLTEDNADDVLRHLNMML